MKKVGILTYWFATNYGAVLQAYALREKLNSIKNVSAEIIMYKPYGHKDIPDSGSNIINKKYRNKRESFDLFLVEKLGCCMENVIHHIEDDKYDFYCVGSDQVWNMGFDFWSEAYLLNTIKDNTKKISYAASIGLDVNDTMFKKDLFEKYIKQFKHVSIRESEQLEYIRSIGIKCDKVVDPVLLHDKEKYEKLIPRTPLYESEFILFFCIDEDNVFAGVEFANYLSIKFQLPIVHSFVDPNYYVFNKDEGSMLFSSVEDFLWYIKNAKYIVTNSYHCVLFSIIFEKEFYVLNNRIKMKSRFNSLNNLVSIEKREINNIYFDRNNCNKLDYKLIKQKIAIERMKSEQYISEILEK